MLAEGLDAESLALRRAVVEALGRVGNATAVPALLESVTGMDGLEAGSVESRRIAEHSVAYALMEIHAPEETLAGLENSSPAVRRTALWALGQMESGGLNGERLARFLDDEDEGLREAALWVAGRHPEWGAALAEGMRERLLNREIAGVQRAELEEQLGQLGAGEAIQKLVLEVAVDEAAGEAARVSALRVMQKTRLKASPHGWAEVLWQCLSDANEAVVRAAVEAARTMAPLPVNAPDLTPSLLRLAREDDRETDLRLAALAALPSRMTELDAGLHGLVLSAAQPSEPVSRRSMAAGILARQTRSNSQLLSLLDTVREAHPLDLTRLLSAYERCTNETVGLELVRALENSRAAGSLQAGNIQPVLTNFPGVVKQAADQLFASWNTSSTEQGERLEAMMASLPDGDVRRGQTLFNSAQTACSTCHAIGYLGGDLGPDLTRIGQVRTRRDLLEAVVYPSASLVRSYEPWVVVTRDGETHSGVLRRDAPEEIVLATGPGVEVRIGREDVQEIRSGEFSLMPGGMADHLSEQALADLLAFLEATRW
jgi:putative heme-binding domain-containing protein